jgi:hypothetical protein
MHSTTVAVDLAKNIFELVVADAEGKIGERLRLNRARLARACRVPCRGASLPESLAEYDGGPDCFANKHKLGAQEI